MKLRRQVNGRDGDRIGDIASNAKPLTEVFERAKHSLLLSARFSLASVRNLIPNQISVKSRRILSRSVRCPEPTTPRASSLIYLKTQSRTHLACCLHQHHDA